VCSEDKDTCIIQAWWHRPMDVALQHSK
jgi:hypothetical protein